LNFVFAFACALGVAGIYVLVRYVGVSRGRGDSPLDQISAYGFTAIKQDAGEAERTPFAEIASAVGRRLKGTRIAKSEEEMRGLLVQAGMYGTSPDRLLGSQLFTALGLGILFIWLSVAGGVNPGLIVFIAIFAIVGGWMLPLAYVRRKIRVRHDQIEYELPELIDLLVVSLEAGLSFPGSMRLAADRVRGPLGQELRLTLQEQNMGLSPEEALTNLQQRADTPGMAVFTRSVIQGQALGVSMGQIMRNIAEEMRKRRKAAAEERAQKAPIKMLFPLAFLIFPAMFVVILLPAFLTIAEQFGNF
jgi:tight adherence protein C